jgi:hypothetical protein
MDTYTRFDLLVYSLIALLLGIAAYEVYWTWFKTDSAAAAHFSRENTGGNIKAMLGVFGKTGLVLVVLFVLLATIGCSVDPNAVQQRLAPIEEPTPVPVVVEPTPVPVVVEPTAVPVVVEPTAVPVVVESTLNLEDLNVSDIVDYLAENDLTVYNKHLFGESWLKETGKIIAEVPEDYNLTVLSMDPGTVKIDNVSFSNGQQGLIAVVVGNANIEVTGVGFSTENEHRNISGYSISLDEEALTNDDTLADFALRLLAFEWSREHKPSAFLYVDGEVYEFEADSDVDMDDEGAVLDYIKEIFDPEN